METCWKCRLPIEPHGDPERPEWVLAESVDPNSIECYRHDPNWIVADWFLKSGQRSKDLAEDMWRARVRASKCLANR